jgi:nicotinamide-nucleotide amidase
MPEIHLRLSVRHPDPATAQELLKNYSERIESKISKYLFGFDQDTFIGTLATLFREQKKTLALAESCTGGLIARLITAEAGASAYFNFSAVTYSNEAKMAVLNVPREAIEKDGAVSEAVVRAMSEGARRIGQADIAVAVSGIAGPDGGSPEKPVGTVDIAIATPKTTYYRRFHFPGDRERIQIITAYAALQLVRRILLGQDPLAFHAPEKTKKV